MIKFGRIFCLLLAVGSLAAACNKSPVAPLNQPAHNYTVPARLNGIELLVEVADTIEQQRQGLSGRLPLSDNQGMLFDFRGTDQARPGFWMKDMKFDLDLIWLKDNRVVAITPNVPAPNTPDNALPTYSPPADIDMVLEVNAGWSERHNIPVGATLEFQSSS